jgi:hypothetical protein
MRGGRIAGRMLLAIKLGIEIRWKKLSNYTTICETKVQWNLFGYLWRQNSDADSFCHEVMDGVF